MDREKHTENSGSIIDPSYSTGNYFSDSKRFSSDAGFKAGIFIEMFTRFLNRYKVSVKTFVDVGCGSGDIIKIIADSLRTNVIPLASFRAYDVSPHIQNIKNEGVSYVMGDFCDTNDNVDVVTLFDVLEHVPNTIGFLKNIAQRCKVIGLHIPLDHSLNSSLRNRYREYLHNPGHLINLDISSALNLLAFSDLRVVDFEYTFAFMAPTGHSSIPSKILYPFRFVLAKLNPWLLSKTLGGASLMVIALTPQGLRELES